MEITQDIYFIEYYHIEENILLNIINWKVT